jgi:UDP-2,3-diacylglucosamine hydrolase
MRIWIFSDLHLTDSKSSLYQAFLKTLSEPNRADDVVVFSGDIFDLLIGASAYFQEKFSGFFTAVNALHARGVKLHYIEGNHDFHLRELFSEQMKFHDDAVILEDASFQPAKKIYIAHGDLVDTNDYSYLRLRGFLRSGPIQRLSKTLPGKWIENLGNVFSRNLEQKADEIPEHWSQTKQAELRKVFRAFAKAKHEAGCDFVALGHCHDLDQIEPYYFNMGYPPVHQQYLFYESQANPASLKRVRFLGLN